MVEGKDVPVYQTTKFRFVLLLEGYVVSAGLSQDDATASAIVKEDDTQSEIHFRVTELFVEVPDSNRTQNVGLFSQE